MHIYTTIDEILRVKALDRKEQLILYKNYQLTTSSSRITCLRMFIKGIKDLEFPSKEKDNGDIQQEEQKPNIEDNMSERTKKLREAMGIAKKRWGQPKEESKG